MSKKSIFMSTLILFPILLFSSGCASIIKPGKKGMMWRPWSSGLDEKKTYDDGVVWHWPWNNVIDYDVTWKNYRERVALLTADDLHIEVTVSVVLRPYADELPQLALEIGRDYYSRLVRPEFFTITRSVFAGYLHNNISEKSPEIEQKILTLLKERLKGKHLEFDNMTLDHIMYSPIVTEAVDQKLAVKQILEQKEFEAGIAERDAEIQRIRARGQRDAQKIIDEGMTKKYLQFKSLEVQEKLAESSNAKFYFIPLGKDGLPVIIDTGGK